VLMQENESNDGTLFKESYPDVKALEGPRVITFGAFLSLCEFEGWL
jgi:hypothetical protein